jgi:hypothetical protein
MSIVDILTGRQPLFKSTTFKRRVVDVEQDYVRLVNTDVKNRSLIYSPKANQSYIDEAIAEDNKSQPRAAQSYTLNTITPIKVCDTQGEMRKVILTCIKIGTTAYVSHDRIRLTNFTQGIRNGVPVTNAGAGQPNQTTVTWQGEMWAVGSVANTLLDVEMA